MNADVNHDTTAMVNVEVTDPGNSQNNLVVADGLTQIKGRGNYTWTLPSKKKPYQSVRRRQQPERWGWAPPAPGSSWPTRRTPR